MVVGMVSLDFSQVYKTIFDHLSCKFHCMLQLAAEGAVREKSSFPRVSIEDLLEKLLVLWCMIHPEDSAVSMSTPNQS